MVDETLRTEHVTRFVEDKYVRLYDALCAEYERTQGALTGATQGIVADIVYQEQLKAALIRDINENGLGRKAYNGRQYYWQDNKSVGAYKGACEQQRKLYAELRLTPASSKLGVIGAAAEDEFNTF